MKIIYILLASIVLTFAGFMQNSACAQETEIDTIKIAKVKADSLQTEKVRVDTVRIETVRVDTVWVEKVKVDTVRVETVKTEPKREPAKEPEKSSQNAGNKRDKVYYGGYANFSFGKYTVIGFEPLVAYKLLPKLSVGAKFSYEWVKDKRYDDVHKVSNYGAGVFTRLRITPKLYAHFEYSGMNYKLYDSLGNSDRKWVPFLWLGGGFSKQISKNATFTAEVLWDLLQNDNSPYKTVEPVFNVGIGVGF